MVIHLDVDPKKCSYQFLYEAASFETNPETLQKIFNTVENDDHEPTDCDPSVCNITDIDCSYDGVIEALSRNQNTPHDVLVEIAHSDDFCLRGTLARHVRFDDIIDMLLEDQYTIVLNDVLNNSHCKRKHFKRIFNRFINHDIDFDIPENEELTTVVDFANILSKHRLATMTEIIFLGKWLVKNT